MSGIRCRTVTPMSLMTDVYVEFERLRHVLDELRDELVLEPALKHVELGEAKRHCRKLIERLDVVDLLLVYPERLKKVPPPPAPPPPFRPKLVG
jgi:hypothetical protein